MEIALSEFCGPNDIIPPHEPEDEAIRQRLGFRSPQHYLKRLSQYRPQDWYRLLAERRRAVLFHGHMPASSIQQLVPRAVWDSYLKFSIERNPWDKTISQHAYKRAIEPDTPSSLYDYLLESASSASPVSNWPIYTVDGQTTTNFMVWYESLADDLAKAGEMIGLPKPLRVEGIHAKSGTRSDQRPYQEVLTPDERDFIYHLCRREIEAFGYTF